MQLSVQRLMEQEIDRSKMLSMVLNIINGYSIELKLLVFSSGSGLSNAEKGLRVECWSNFIEHAESETTFKRETLKP